MLGSTSIVTVSVEITLGQLEWVKFECLLFHIFISWVAALMTLVWLSIRHQSGIMIQVDYEVECNLMTAQTKIYNNLKLRLDVVLVSCLSGTSQLSSDFSYRRTLRIHISRSRNPKCTSEGSKSKLWVLWIVQAMSLQAKPVPILLLNTSRLMGIITCIYLVYTWHIYCKYHCIYHKYKPYLHGIYHVVHTIYFLGIYLVYHNLIRICMVYISIFMVYSTHM